MHAVADRAAEEREEQDRTELERADEPQPERGVGQLEHEPRLADALHPRADQGDELPAPEQPEVAMTEGAQARGNGHGPLYCATDAPGRRRTVRRAPVRARADRARRAARALGVASGARPRRRIGAWPGSSSSPPRGSRIRASRAPWSTSSATTRTARSGS